MGYPITVFEKEKQAGGMLRYAIPPYRLPDRILKREIDWIKDLGIDIKSGVKIKDPSSLFKKGYSAVLIAGGAPKTFPLNIDGEKAEGVLNALEFLKEINEKKHREIKGNVVVIGGGSTAFDTARSALRLGAKKVTLAYRRGIKEMPADKEEIESAKEEGVELLTLSIPKKIITKANKVVKIEFLKAKLGKPDSSGRQRPEPIKNSGFTMKADIVIPAIGAMPDIGPVGGVKVTTPRGIIDVANYGNTVVEGVFAAGDVEMGPSSVVEAIGRGHQAAEGINAYLRGTSVSKPEEIFDTVQISLGAKQCSNNIYSPKKLVEGKTDSFDEVEGSLTDFEAVEEASRCFSCGPCYACPTCLPNCKNKQLVATIDNISFLIKSPLEISEDITKKGPAIFKIKTERQTKSVKLQALTANVDKDLCIGCGRCEEVCAYRAIKNVINKDQRTFAEVGHSSCASCSACVSECPAGAISQGFMSDKEILKRIESKKTPYEGVIALMSFWSTAIPVFGGYEGIIELMSARKPSPMFLIRALARSGRGILVIKPDIATGSHYLPWEEHPDEILQRTWNLLKSIGISTDRIQYKELPKGKHPSMLLKDFSDSLVKKRLKKLKIPIPENISSPFGETIAIIRMMGANPDIKSSEKTIQLASAKKDGTAYFEGCLPLLHNIGRAHKLYDLSSTRSSIFKLLNLMNIKAGLINDLKCPSKGLLEIKKEEVKPIISKIYSDNLKLFKKLNPKKIIMATPEAYNSFSDDKNYHNISALPEELLKRAAKKKNLQPINRTIAVHKACKMQYDPFYKSTLEILRLIPGIKIVELKGKCGHESFDKLNGDLKQTALNLIKESKKKKADFIVCTSPYCLSHLLLCQREGSWRLSDIEIGDVYQLLLESYGGVL